MLTKLISALLLMSSVALAQPTATDRMVTVMGAIARPDAQPVGRAGSTLNKPATTQPFTANPTTNTIQSVGHGLTVGAIVRFRSTSPSPLSVMPVPLLAANDYYVVSATANGFSVSVLSGGATVDILSAGVGTHEWTSRVAMTPAEELRFVESLVHYRMAILYGWQVTETAVSGSAVPQTKLTLGGVDVTREQVAARVRGLGGRYTVTPADLGGQPATTADVAEWLLAAQREWLRAGKVAYRDPPAARNTADDDDLDP